MKAGKEILRTLFVRVVILVAILSFLASCSPQTTTAQADRETLTQVSTISALMAGVYDGIITSGQLKSYGDFGIGTFDSLDGEMIELDGKVYQVKADGVANPVVDSLELPFAAVTFFDNEQEVKIPPGTNLADLQQAIEKAIPSTNIFYAIKIRGNFSYIKTRSVPRQTKPYPVLTEATKNQSVFEFNNIDGTVVGFWCPEYVNGVNVPGFHLHFLTADLRAGGHVLDLNTGNVAAWLDYTPKFFMILPDMNSDFYKVNLSGDNSQAMQEAEK